MEYLPLPVLARRQHPQIPLLCSEQFEYPFGSVAFDQYPRLHGLDFELYDQTLYIDPLLPTEQDVERLLATLQEWLFFGLLSEFAQRRIRAVDFTSAEAGQRFLDGTNVNVLIAEKHAVFKQRDLEANQEHYQKLDGIFTQCRDMIEITDLWCRDHEHRYPSAAVMVLTITCLATTLEMSIYRSCSHLRILGTVTYCYPSHFLRNRLIKEGWCPRLAKSLESALSPVEVYYASMLDRPVENHNKCTREDCVAHDLDPTTYRTQHLKDNCECEEICIDEDKLTAILLDGGIPIVETWKNSKGHITVQPVDSGQRRVYVAISRKVSFLSPYTAARLNVEMGRCME